ncbi:hypothetical protein L6164_018253 [Bauhinia variegata]|uniref:Uncharacterized protein n=1 Tax=Bauhinia variegata TaxID=167791 RepID=A0ACB9NE24_BAUVA|nr:hypothetical protein L6164_018253 [Bauhinia variegata]
MADVKSKGSSCYLQADNVQEPNIESGRTINGYPPPPLLMLDRCKWWLIVAVNAALLLIGQSGAFILGKFYFHQGGESIWMETLVQAAGFPILFLSFFFFPQSKHHLEDSALNRKPSIYTLVLVYFSLGILFAGDNFLYSIGFLYLPASTYSLICASQLAFNAIFSFLINSQKLTVLVLNSVILVSLSASLIAVHSDSSGDKNKRVSDKEYKIGFLCTLAASAGYSLLLSLMQLSFEKVLKRETLSVVLEMQIWTSLVASVVSIVGLFASGEGKSLKEEMKNFEAGKLVYILTLVGTALAWQVWSVGVVGLVYLVSSLFSNVISMLSLPLVPVAAVYFYHEKMDAVKIVAVLLAVLGFSSYIYQSYLDEKKLKASSSS